MPGASKSIPNCHVTLWRLRNDEARMSKHEGIFCPLFCHSFDIRHSDFVICNRTMNDTEAKIEEAIKNPKNLGEMSDADAVGTVGSADCGDMLRMWIKFREENGRKVIDRATFQSFGCQTAIAVASVATEMLKGKTAAEASTMSGEELSAPLGPLPPVKIHCAQLVEGALRNALGSEPAETRKTTSPTLIDQLSAATQPTKVKIVLDNKEP